MPPPDHGAIWENWSGCQKCRPAVRLFPQSEEDLAAAVREAKAAVRVVGAGHSFSPLVPTDQTLISLDRMSGICSVDAPQQSATCWAGTRIHDLGQPLAQHGLALINQGDVDAQSLGGALGTGTHGTGRELGCLASCLKSFRLVTAAGEILEASPDQNAKLFAAGRVSLGALGIMSQVTIQCRPAYGLEERIVTMPLEEFLERAPQLAQKTRHFEFFHFPYAGRTLVKTLRELPAITASARHLDEDEDRLFHFLCRILHRLPSINPLVQKLAMWTYRRDARSGPSYQIFPSARTARFHEMEYSVPAESGPACFREVIQKLRKARAEVLFPIEFRYVRQDDIWLSPFYERNSAAISVHQYHQRPYADLFALVEPIFWKYAGRPHWGKLHTLAARQLQPLYPCWSEFLALRRELDPRGRFLNEHLRTVLGESPAS